VASQVDGLLAKSAQAANLLISVRAPVQSVFVMGELPSVALPDGRVMVELGDLYAGETRKLVLRFHVPAISALGLATVAELTLQYVELPSLDSHTVTVPISVNVVPGDEAAGRLPDPAVRTEIAFQQAQESKRQASAALRRGDTTTADGLLRDAGLALGEAMASAPMAMVDELQAEQTALGELADRTGWDDANLLAKSSYADWHNQTRRRGRPPR